MRRPGPSRSAERQAIVSSILAEFPMSDEQPIHDDCEQHDCFLPTSRRRFLRDSFLSVASALVAVGMNKATALAMPLEFTEATRSVGLDAQLSDSGHRWRADR